MIYFMFSFYAILETESVHLKYVLDRIVLSQVLSSNNAVYWEESTDLELRILKEWFGA